MELKDVEYSITFIGDGATNYKNKILETLPNSKFVSNNDVSAKNVGLYAYGYSLIHTYPSIDPMYLRKSEAERKLNSRKD